MKHCILCKLTCRLWISWICKRCYENVASKWKIYASTERNLWDCFSCSTRFNWALQQISNTGFTIWLNVFSLGQKTTGNWARWNTAFPGIFNEGRFQSLTFQKSNIQHLHLRNKRKICLLNMIQLTSIEVLEHNSSQFCFFKVKRSPLLMYFTKFSLDIYRDKNNNYLL